MSMMAAARCGPPGKPVIDSVSATSIALHWDKPRNTGNGQIQGYIVDMKPTGGAWHQVNVEPVRNPEMVVSHLTEGQKYQFSVTAVNEAGPGPPSIATASVVAEKPAGTNLNFILARQCLGLFPINPVLCSIV